MEGYAYNRFDTIREAYDYLSKFVDIEYSKFCVVLINPLICGYIEYKRWNVSFRKAQHKGVINLETFNKIQEKLDSKKLPPVNVKTKIGETFPLRGYIKSVETGEKFTGGFSTNGSGKKVPYYQSRVRRENLEEKGFKSRSYEAGKVHDDLVQLLNKIEPTDGIVKLAQMVFSSVWNNRVTEENILENNLKAKIKSNTKSIEELLDKIVNVKSEIVLKTYEKKIESLEKENMVLKEKLTAPKLEQKNYQIALNSCL